MKLYRVGLIAKQAANVANVAQKGSLTMVANAN